MSRADHDLGELIRVEGGRALATLTRQLGDLQLAEDALQDATVLALERWPRDGVPRSPAAWLTTTARHKALDRLRREGRRSRKEEAAVRLLEPDGEPDEPDGEAVSALRDDTVRLIFTCCHPALAPEARVALCLRTLCGLSTAEIAHSFVISEPTMAQRIVRAKHKIAAAHIPYRVPSDHELPERLPAVLAVVYVIFTEGHAASAGDDLVRIDLCDEAIRLARLLADLLPDEPEVLGLLALLLLTDARRVTRTDAGGELVLLADQDRTRWDADHITEGSTLVELALRRSAGRPGPYALQAAIAACHATAPSFTETDWPEIVVLYTHLERVQPSDVVRLNRAVAVAEVDGPAAGLLLVDLIDGLDRFQHFHSARADMLRRLGRHEDAAGAYRAALALGPSTPEQRFLRRRLAEVTAGPSSHLAPRTTPGPGAVPTLEGMTTTFWPNQEHWSVEIPLDTPHPRPAAMAARGFVQLRDLAEVVPEDEYLGLEYMDWKSGGDTNFAPIATADGALDCRGFWSKQNEHPDKDAIFTSNADQCPTLRRWVEDVGANFGRVRTIKLEPQSHDDAIRSFHRDDNNRFNPPDQGWVVRSWLELTDNPESYMLLMECGADGLPDPATEMRVPLHRGAQFVVDTQRLWHVVVHNGPAARYALISSFEASPALDAWIARSI